MPGFPDQRQSAGSEPRGSAVQQTVRRGCSSEDSPGSFPSYGSSHQALNLDLAADHMAEIGRGNPSGQKGVSNSVTARPNIDQRSAPQRQESTLPRGGYGYQPRGVEISEINRNRESVLKGRSAPGGAEEPVAEAGHQPQSVPSWFFGTIFPPFRSAGKPSGESSGSSPSKHVKQGKAEADKTQSKTDPLEVGLKALRSSSHPQSSQFLQALERPIQIVNNLLGENQHLQKELNNSHSQQERLHAEVKQLQRELQKRQSSKGVPEHYLVAENQRLQQELQKLKNTQEAVLADLRAENQELRQELEELQNRLVPESETTTEEMPVPQSIAFPVQVQRSGETGGCEKHFLLDVAKLLNGHKVSLQVEEYQEDSEHLLLLFSPITNRAGTNINDALSGLKNMQKTLLVVFHHEPKSNTKVFVDTKLQVQHPALVGTVHACFSIQDGFYHCQINQDAVESVAAIIMQLTRDG